MARLRGALFFLLLMLVATLASGVLSYLLVTHYRGATPDTGTPSQTEMVQGQLMRGFSNGVVSLANALAHRTAPGQAVSPENSLWIQRQFRAELNKLRLQLAEAAVVLGTPGEHLLNAADRLAAFAAQPDNLALRERALHEVREAAAAAETALRTTRADRWLAEPPVLPAW